MPAESRASYEGWRVAAAAGTGVFFAALVVVTFPLLLKPWAAEFGWSREEIARAFAIAAAVAAVGAAPLGAWLDRVGPRRVVVPALTLLGAAFASLALLTPRLPHLYLTYAVLGAAGIATSPVAYARAVSTWFTMRRGLALAFVVTGGALGGVVLPPLTQALLTRMGWRGACLVLGIVVLAVGVPTALAFVREHPEGRARDAAASGTRLGEGLRTRVFGVLAFVIFGGTMLQNAVIVHLAALLTDRGVTAAGAAGALSAMAAAAVLGRLATGMLIDHAHAARLATVLMALAGLGAFALAGARSPFAGVVGAMLVGFGTGGESDVIPYLVSRHFGLRAFSALYGVAWTIGAAGGALGPVLLGRAFDRSGWYEAAIVGIGGVTLAAAASLLFLPRPSAVSVSPR